MADLENWMSLFRDNLDQKTYDFIFKTLVTDQFTSRLQLKLLTSEQLDYMFSKDLTLGAKALLVCHVELLKDESPLLTKTKERWKGVHGIETSTATRSQSKCKFDMFNKFARGHRCSVTIFNRSAPLSIFM